MLHIAFMDVFWLPFKDTRSGTRYLRNQINTYPHVLEYRIALAEVYVAANHLDQASAVLKQVLQGHSQYVEANLLMASVQEKQQRFQEAIPFYLQAALAAPANPKPLFRMGLLYLHLGQSKTAVEHFQRVLAANERFPRVHYHIGQAAFQSRNYPVALQAAEREKQVNPNLIAPYSFKRQNLFATRPAQRGDFRVAKSGKIMAPPMPRPMCFWHRPTAVWEA